MNEPGLAEMHDSEFQEAIDRYIDRAAVGAVEPPAELFFDLLAERLAQNIEETVTLSVDIANHNLILHPDRESAGILIRGNEILIGKHRFILQLNETAMASA